MKKNTSKKRTKNNITKIKKVLIIICIVLTTILTMFLFLANKPTDEELIDDVSKYKTHDSYNKLFSINAPGTWKPVEVRNSLNKNAIIELENEDKNSYLVVVVNNKKDLNENFNTYKTKVFSQKESYYKTKISSYHNVVINGYNAQYGIIYYTNENNINTYIRSYAIETKNYYGQIVIWTLASNENSSEKEFDNIINSFKEK